MEIPKEFVDIFRGTDLTEDEIRTLNWITGWEHQTVENLRSAVQKAQGAALTPPNEWVSVEERLPEYNPGTGAKSYWVAKKDNAGNWQMKIAQYCDYGYAMTMDAETEVTWRDWDFTKIANVTHWMLLPAPPESRPPEGEEDQHGDHHL